MLTTSLAPQSEAQIQAEVVKFLQSNGVFFFSVPNELAGANAGARMSKFIATGLRKGAPDLVIFWPDGQLGFLEMKTPTGKQSPQQKVFQKKCEEYGARYDLARSVEGVACLLRRYS